MTLPSALHEIRLPTAKRQRTFYPHSKASGVDWLSTIPSGWNIKRLRYAVSFPAKSEVRGLPIDTPVSFVPMEAIGEYGGMNLEQTKPVAEVLNGYTYFADDDIVVAKITPCFENGKGALAQGLENGVGFGTTELHVLRAGNELLPRFLLYLTFGEHFRKLGTAEMYGAGGQKRVPERFLKDIRHPIPPLDEQRSIATFLDGETAKVDELVDKKSRLISLLSNKREARIAAAVTAKIGDGKSVPIKRFLTFTTSGSRGWAEFYSDEGDLFIQSGNLNRRLGLDLSSVQKIIPPEGAEARRTMIRRDDILVCITGAYTGNVAVVDFDPPRAFINQHIALLRVDSRRAVPRFLAYLLASSFGQGHFKASQYGGTKQGLGFDDILSVVVSLPQLIEQERIVQELDSEIALIEQTSSKIEDCIRKLRQYRSAIVSAAVTGQIDVRNYRPEAPCQ